MDAAAIVDELRAVALFADLPAGPLAWLAARAAPVRLEAGGYVVHEGDANGVFFVQLDGRTEWTKNVDGQEVYALTHGAGAWYGHEPILLDIPVPVSGRALTPLRLLTWDADAFWGLIGLCPSIVRGLLKTIAQRVQTVETVSQQQTKLAALGKLAAGLAHELNNPAAAASRAVRELGSAVDHMAVLGPELGRLGLTPEQAATVERARGEAARPTSAGTTAGLGGLALSDREDGLAGWLESQGADDAWDLAATFAAAGTDTAWLEGVAAAVPPAALGAVLAYLAATLTAGALLHEAGAAVERVSRLVGAVKEYSYLDQGPEQEVDVNAGLESTLTILGHRLREGRIAVARNYDPARPRVWAAGGELNQVWTELIDNAVDAIGGLGEDGGWIGVRTALEPGRVLVEVADDGPGIPPDVLPRIWEPFFTTKGVGAGTGLGLDTVRRTVVERHGGDVRVESRPGETRFQVRLPMNGRLAAEATTGPAGG